MLEEQSAQSTGLSASLSAVFLLYNFFIFLSGDKLGGSLRWVFLAVFFKRVMDSSVQIEVGSFIPQLRDSGQWHGQARPDDFTWAGSSGQGKILIHSYRNLQYSYTYLHMT